MVKWTIENSHMSFHNSYVSKFSGFSVNYYTEQKSRTKSRKPYTVGIDFNIQSDTCNCE